MRVYFGGGVIKGSGYEAEVGNPEAENQLEQGIRVVSVCIWGGELIG